MKRKENYNEKKGKTIWHENKNKIFYAIVLGVLSVSYCRANYR